MLLVASLLLGCGGERKLSDEDREVRAFGREIAALSSTNTEERIQGAIATAVYCCSFEPEQRPARARIRPRACAALERALVSEREPRVLEGLLWFSNETCDVEVPSDRILDLSSKRSPIQRKAVQWLQLIEPSPAVATMALREARGLERDEEPRAMLLIALGTFGEPDLVPVLDALADSDPHVRGIGVQALSFALSEAPLEFPGALAALERLAHDSDTDLASYAESIAVKYRNRHLGSPDSVLEDYLADGTLAFNEIRMIGVRRFFCNAKGAQETLERIARDAHNAGHWVMAKRALAIRAKRCDSPQPGG